MVSEYSDEDFQKTKQISDEIFNRFNLNLHELLALRDIVNMRIQEVRNSPEMTNNIPSSNDVTGNVTTIGSSEEEQNMANEHREIDPWSNTDEPDPWDSPNEDESNAGRSELDTTNNGGSERIIETETETETERTETDSIVREVIVKMAELCTVEPNTPKVEYLKFINELNTYLKMIRKPLPFAAELSCEILSYPLSVTYDEKRFEWFICERTEQKIVQLNVGNDPKLRGAKIITNSAVKNPSACIIYEEGKSIAILCSETHRTNYSIQIYNMITQETMPAASHEDPIYKIFTQLRGLAKSKHGNFLTLDSDPHKISRKRLRVLKKDHEGRGFELPQSVNPSFLASIDDRVAVSDLGNQKIYLLKVNDTDWNNIDFQVLKVIYEEPKPANEMCNIGGFLFAAGLQFDVNGMLLVGDAKGHSIKLFGQELEFYHRLSSDFPIPYMSSFFVNSKGEMLILDIRSTTGQKFIFAQLTATDEVGDWIPAITAPPRGNGRGRPYSNMRKTTRGAPGFMNRGRGGY